MKPFPKCLDDPPEDDGPEAAKVISESDIGRVATVPTLTGAPPKEVRKSKAMNASLFCLIVAGVCFLFAAFTVNLHPRINMTALGLLFVVLSYLLRI